MHTDIINAHYYTITVLYDYSMNTMKENIIYLQPEAP